MKRTKRFLVIAFIAGISVLSAQAEKVAQAIWTEGNTTLTFIYDEKVYKEGDTFNGQTVTNIQKGGDLRYSWKFDVRSKITMAVFDKSFKDYLPTTIYTWFNECNNLTTIVGLENLNTSNVINMGYLFFGCESLSSLDLSNFDTSNVIYMNDMFRDCSNLESLNISKFNTSNVEDMSMMFSGCSTLKSLDLSNFDTSKVQSMSQMFEGCGNLRTLDLSNFNTSNVESMWLMFSSCEKLRSLNVSSFDTNKVKDMSGMFSYCKRLAEIDIRNFNITNADVTKLFYNCSSLEKIDLSNFDTSNSTSLNLLFGDCSSLKSIDLSNFKTNNVTDMSGMFSGCSSLTSLDISNFNTSNVTNMSGMFAGCNFSQLNLGEFNTEKVTNMANMFQRSDIANLDLSRLNTENVTNMSQMFCRSSYTYLDLSGFKTNNLTNMYMMFCYCDYLTSLDLTSFNTENVTDMAEVFGACKSLKNLAVSNGFITNNVTKVDNYEFYQVSDLTVYTDAESLPSVKEAFKKINFYNGNYDYGVITSTVPLSPVSADDKNYWATYYNSVASMAVPSGIDAYTGMVVDESLVLTKIEDGIIPKGNAVILRGDADNMVINVGVAPKGVFADNELKGVDMETRTPEHCYALSIEDGKAGLYKYTERRVNGHEAYLVYGQNESIVGFPFLLSDETTGIASFEENHSGSNVYNIQGQQLNAMRHGLNIVNRRKLFVK